MIIHMHSILPIKNTFPEINTFYWNNYAKHKLNTFVKQIIQLENIDMFYFKSNSDYSLFRKRKGQEPLLCLLKKHKIDLSQGDNLIMLSTIKKRMLTSIREKVWQCLITYPAHRIEYLKNIESFLKKNSLLKKV